MHFIVASVKQNTIEGTLCTLFAYLSIHLSDLLAPYLTWNSTYAPGMEFGGN